MLTGVHGSQECSDFGASKESVEHVLLSVRHMIPTDKIFSTI